jgi:DNA-binding XRE family transcriptional regulator
MVNLENVSFIQDSHGKKAVILSLEVFEEMQERLEELEDIKAYTEVKSRDEENLPMELVEKLLLGEESKIRIFREYRKYNLTELANLVEISDAYLSQIENKKRKGNIDLYKKLAKVLDIDVDLLI